jgi:hypothetical protein
LEPLRCTRQHFLVMEIPLDLIYGHASQVGSDGEARALIER